MVARRKHNNAGFPRACRNAMHSETAFKQSKAGAAQLKYGQLQSHSATLRINFAQQP